jgi:hypothetical protein
VNAAADFDSERKFPETHHRAPAPGAELSPVLLVVSLEAEQVVETFTVSVMTLPSGVRGMTLCCRGLEVLQRCSFGTRH